MYSTSIRDNKCLVECIAVLDRVRVTKFIVDTGISMYQLPISAKSAVAAGLTIKIFK